MSVNPFAGLNRALGKPDDLPVLFQWSIRGNLRDMAIL